MESTYSETCKSCTENRIRFKEDKKDCDVLFDVIDERRSKLSHQEGDQGQHIDVSPPAIRSVGNSTDACHWCENSRICSDFYRLTIHPFLRTVVDWLTKDVKCDTGEARRNLICEEPHLNMDNHDGELCQLLCDVTVLRANVKAEHVLDDLRANQATQEGVDNQTGAELTSPPRNSPQIDDGTVQISPSPSPSNRV